MEMENITGELKKKLMMAEQTVRHKSGLWNLIWTDMMIESTFMKTGKGPGGLKGLTLKPEGVKKWAFSLNTFADIDRHVEDYLDNDSFASTPRVHKEEKRILSKMTKVIGKISD